ncbi:MaoC family dehydratase [Caballeronia sp. LZ065]|uniref:MaoC family dehydratase n=1 Tax=Caballeronia sp. LZ065 TaxID=3038571 RepID=UPI002865DB6D|nr:MaoC family dehydratase [Caballeronia sp. LZ065]MDR5780762.1 MaoC family dehydratase [Caballeronia sp. LZ065]
MTQALLFEEIEPGLSFATSGIVVTESHVVQFAGLSGDFFDVHMDDDFARSVGFPGRIAHGLLCLAMVDGLKNRAATRLASVATLEWTYRFHKPVMIGDRIQGRISVLDKRPTKRADRGIVRLQVEVRNQDDVVIQEGVNVLMVRTRAHAEKTSNEER